MVPVAVLSGNRNFPGASIRRSRPASSPRRRSSSPMRSRATSTATSSPIRSALRADGARSFFLRSLADRRRDRRCTGRSAPTRRTTALPTRRPRPARSGASSTLPHALFPWDLSRPICGGRRSRRPPGQTRLGRYAAHPLLVLGDDITTDHISPAGQIPARSEAGRVAHCAVARIERPQCLRIAARAIGRSCCAASSRTQAVRNELDPADPARLIDPRTDERNPSALARRRTLSQRGAS